MAKQRNFVLAKCTIPDSNFEPNMKSWSAWIDTDKGKDGSMKPKKQSFEIGLLKKVRDTEYDHDA
jgi:hypothetical protein